MNILYFHQHFSTPTGATGIRSYEMAKRLVADGHQVTMVCGSYSGGNTGLNHDFTHGFRRGVVDGIDVIEYDLAYANADGLVKRAWIFLKFALRSIKLSLTLKYDLVFATSTPLTAGIPGIFAKLFRRKPFVFEVRDLWPELPKAMGVIKNPLILALLSFLEWASYKNADRCIGLSPGIVKGIKARSSKDKSVYLIPNGCDLSLFNLSTEQYIPSSIEPDDFVALFSGTHGKANGLDAVLDAALAVQNQGVTHIKFLLVGQGKLKPALVEKAKQLKLNNVLFHDPINKTKLSNLMNRANLGMQVLTNTPAFYYGTSPNKFFDYLAAGLPVLNNYPGWVADLVNEHQCGIVVQPDNANAFADALISLSNSPTQLKEMAANAKALSHEFDRSKQGQLWVEAVTGVINEENS